MRSFSALAHLRAMLVAGAVMVHAAPVAGAQQPMLDVTRFAQQLGLLLVAPNNARSVTIGDAITGAATDPLLLHRIGVRGAHRGARVVIARVAADHVMVEVDELLPAPTRTSVRLEVAKDGTLKLP
jgi:hypothetical protein